MLVFLKFQKDQNFLFYLNFFVLELMIKIINSKVRKLKLYKNKKNNLYFSFFHDYDDYSDAPDKLYMYSFYIFYQKIYFRFSIYEELLLLKI